MRKNFALASLLLGSVLTVDSVEAITPPVDVDGYVCQAMYTKQLNTLFGQGYVRITVLTAAGCSGSLLGYYYYPGANASIVGYQYSEAERLQLFQQAAKAAKDGTRVRLFVQPTGGCILMTTYFGN